MNKHRRGVVKTRAPFRPLLNGTLALPVEGQEYDLDILTATLPDGTECIRRYRARFDGPRFDALMGEGKMTLTFTITGPAIWGINEGRMFILPDDAVGKTILQVWPEDYRGVRAPEQKENLA